MKKKIGLLVVAVAALTLGAATFAIANNINKNAFPVDAEAYNNIFNYETRVSLYILVFLL